MPLYSSYFPDPCYSSDEPLETPRAQSRFPVQPRTYGHSTSGSESASDLRSPGFPKQFSLSRSHYRTPSSHNNNLQTAVPRRPGLAPLMLGNERNRSNSESYLQATQNNKAKRMGLVTKKNAELDILEETRTHRNSYHLRGQSHGSALRNGVRAGDVSPSGSHSSDRQRGTTVRRLLSLPEQSRDEWPSDNIIEGARDVLYALHLVHPHLATMASVLKDGTTKTTSMEGAYDSVAMHVDYLDQELHKYDGMKDQTSEAGKRLKKSIISATQSCILAHQHVGTILLKSVKQIVRGVDPRYLRTLMLTFYGSLNEISNASRSLGNAQPRVLSQRNTVQRVSTITEVPNEGERMSLRPNSVTPTQERLKPERRWRQGSIVQQSNSYSNLQAAYGTQNAIPLYPNGRSRSNSRAGGLHSSASSSIVSTPRSAETFSLVARSRSGSVNITPEQARMEKQQAAQFERIFTVLNKATTEGLEVIAQLDKLFYHGLDNATKQRASQRIRDLWSTLIANGQYCVEMSDALKRRLSMIRLNDPEARNAPDFWQLVTCFINSYHNLVASLKESRKYKLMPDEVPHWVRPIHALTKEAAKFIAESPWNSLTTETYFHPTPQPQPQTQIRSENGYQQHRAKTSGGSNAGSSSSPYTPSVPATPLSAALGPAAQATVPATPASAIEDSFAGNVWQRADTLQKNQTMFPSRR